MIKVNNIAVYNFSGAFRGLRNPMNSWDRSDSHYCFYVDCDRCPNGKNENDSIICDNSLINSELREMEYYPQDYVIGPADMDLAQRMIKAGSADSKFLRQIFVSMDITAPL